jgi:hypothetical protein
LSFKFDEEEDGEAGVCVVVGFVVIVCVTVEPLIIVVVMTGIEVVLVGLGITEVVVGFGVEVDGSTVVVGTIVVEVVVGSVVGSGTMVEFCADTRVHRQSRIILAYFMTIQILFQIKATSKKFLGSKQDESHWDMSLINTASIYLHRVRLRGGL